MKLSVTGLRNERGNQDDFSQSIYQLTTSLPTAQALQ
ncbi:hypothetical protein PAN31117_05235 [Pandoraea anapnoica]|uniref:Uncharacterized protein n=1 Tax=Pandoraea anapnoica TaxID=2508301 RepID=A0A5E5APL6_9BURK|nr:hypothetical protein PIN31009_05492 [Pandoraea iniqua]VVE75731.1 hypothetical protein PAN31117_05235 [Pandoraea anapnoica]